MRRQYPCDIGALPMRLEHNKGWTCVGAAPKYTHHQTRKLEPEKLRMLTQNIDPLPLQIAPVDEKQRRLTATYILPIMEELFELLVSIRNELDPMLSGKFQGGDKPYPLGRCLEITDAVRDALVLRMKRPRRRAERALVEFIAQGGVVRPIWGALRERYFQNATQIGTLYVDVSNDTVAVIKPRIEILPIERSGLKAIHDISHFRKIAQIYWNSEIYANLVAPTLAPILPMISLNQYGHAKFQNAGSYMVALAMRGQFRDAEQWLATGPAPPPIVVEAFNSRLPPDLRIPKGQDPRKAAIVACRAARAEGRDQDMIWRRDRLLDYFRFRDNCLRSTAA